MKLRERIADLLGLLRPNAAEWTTDVDSGLRGPLYGPPPAPSDPAEVTRKARRSRPIEAALADQAFEDFFQVFPAARGRFETRYVDEPSSEVGGSFGSGWNINPPVVLINLASKADTQPGFRSGKGSIRANVFHEAGHFINLVDGLLRGGQSHIRAMIETDTGMPVAGAIQIDPDLRAALARDVSPYGAKSMRELNAESIVAVLQRRARTSLATNLGGYFIKEYGREAPENKLIEALSQAPGVAYNVPGSAYARVNTLGYCLFRLGPEETFVRTPSEILRISNGGVFGLRVYEGAGLKEVSLGWARSVELGEEVIEPSPRNGEPRVLSDVVIEMACVVPPGKEIESRRADISRGIAVIDDVPPIIAEYEEAQFRSWDRSQDLQIPCRYVETPNGLVTLAIDTPGVTVEFDQLISSFGNTRTVFVEDYSGGRHILGQFEGRSLVGTHGRHQSTTYLGRQEGNSLTIGPGSSSFDFGDGRVLQLDGVRRVEVEASELRLSATTKASLECGQSALWSTREIIDSHTTLQNESRLDSGLVAAPTGSDLSWL